MKMKKMLLNSMVKSSSLLGVEIDRQSMRLVEMSFDGDKYSLLNWINLPFKNPNEKDFVKEVKEAMRKEKIKTRLAAASLPNSLVFTKKIEVMENLSSNDLRKFLSFNIAKEMNVKEKQIVFDYQVIDKNEEKELFFTAATLYQHVNEQVKLFQKLGLKLGIIDIDSNVVQRAKKYCDAGIFSIIDFASNIIINDFKKELSSMMVSFGLALRVGYVRN